MDTLNDLPGTSLSFLSSEVYEPTSALQYVNSQLVSHGFARSPGLSFDGLTNGDSERLVKCLLGMLSQRLEDLGRTEELSSKLRTLSYEHERLESMHRTLVDASANAERESHLSKSKLAAAQKSLATETAAHKQTISELQRTRTSLQYLRSTTQNELKRKDKDLERVMERWNKVADAQAKLLVTPSGLRCANPAVVSTEPTRGLGLMEQALGQAEEARVELVKENDAFRSVILGAANALQGNVYAIRALTTEGHVEEPVPLSHPALFTPPTSILSQPENSHATLRQMFQSLRNAIDNVSTSTLPSTNTPGNDDEIKKLNELVASLRTELQQARQSSTALATQSQALLDRFTIHASERLISGRDPTPQEAAEISLELIGVPERDEAREKLNIRAAKLKTEREKFTEATMKLGKERAALEIERTKFLEEKRRWGVEKMLAELPATPGPDPDLVSPPRPTNSKLKEGSPSPPRVRPRKTKGSPLVSPSKKAAALKRLHGGIRVEAGFTDGCEKPKPKKMGGTLEVLYDPEPRTREQASHGDAGMNRSTTPEESPPVTAPVTLAAEMKSSLPLVLPTTFTLPPPSPASSISNIDLGSVACQHSVRKQQTTLAIPSFDAIPLATTSAPVVTAPLLRPRTFPSPRTPRPTLNPLLKHAYSPARPSPLSRILMLANSPPSPPSVSCIQEEPEDTENGDSPPRRPNTLQNKKLVQYCVPLDEPSPLRQHTDAERNGSASADAGSQGKGDGKRFTTIEKGKARAVPAVQGPTASEKENVAALTVNKPKAVVFNVNASHLKSKVSKLGVPEAKKMTGARPNFKPPAIKGGAAPKVPVENGSGSLGTTNASASGVTAKPGATRRVAIGGANPSKLGVKRV